MLDLAPGFLTPRGRERIDTMAFRCHPSSRWASGHGTVLQLPVCARHVDAHVDPVPSGRRRCASLAFFPEDEPASWSCLPVILNG
jgi:hypothetical protein